MEAAADSNAYKPARRVKKNKEVCFKQKNKIKLQKKNLNEMEISDISHKVKKRHKMLNKPRKKWINKENFNREKIQESTKQRFQSKLHEAEGSVTTENRATT